MRVLFSCGTLLLLLMGQASAQIDSASDGHQRRTTILIAKGDSYLENTVAAMIAESLSMAGITTTTVPLLDLNKEDRQNSDVVVVFNAIKRDQINSTVNKYIKTTEQYGTRSNLLICTVFGEKWNGKEAASDAVTTATKMLNPEPIVSRILVNIRSALREK